MPRQGRNLQRIMSRLLLVQAILGAGFLIGIPGATVFSQEAEGESKIAYADLDAPEHLYWEKPLNDPFTAFLKRLEDGDVVLDHRSEIDYLRSLLSELGISPHTQTLVFSTTSLQLSLISPRNPRAVYYNDDIYLGYIPGGRIEVISMDPELGGIFYIFDIPDVTQPPRVERSDRCMNCHAKPSLGNVPGVVVKSVLPGQRGGSIDTFRRNEIGHHVELSERFGGWHVTGDDGVGKHWGDKIGNLFQGDITTIDNKVGQNFSIDKYPVKGSDILAHLLLEHQAGFVNRTIEAAYRARTHWKTGGNKLKPEHRTELKEHATRLVRYMLFADEAKLPRGKVTGDEELKTDFLKIAKVDGNGRSLRDFDLSDHLFKHRCSYMIYSPVFRGLPDWFRSECYKQLKDALRSSGGEFSYLSAAEKRAIAQILMATVKDPVFSDS